MFTYHPTSKLFAFVRGILEAKSDVTTHYNDLDLLDWYERGLQ